MRCQVCKSKMTTGGIFKEDDVYVCYFCYYEHKNGMDTERLAKNKEVKEDEPK